VGEVRRSAAAAVASVLCLLLLAACGGTGAGNGVVADVRSEDADGLHGAVLTTPYELGEGTLTDTAGQPFAVRSELQKPLTLAFFGYSQCPDICQVVMADLASAVARLESTQADKVDTWFVTTDPARDDPQTLRAYLDRFNPAFEGLTGPLKDIVELAGSVHVPVEKGPRLPSGGYEVMHGTQILGITPDGAVPVLWTEGTSAAKLAEDIDAILRDGVPLIEANAIDGNG
jgi:protein SCO1/2